MYRKKLKHKNQSSPPEAVFVMEWCQKALENYKYGDVLKESILATQCFSDVRQVKNSEEKYNAENNNQAHVKVIQMDTIEVGQQLLQKGYKVVVLNMASEFCPGGGWRKGSMAQEESLFYRSTYCLSLEDPFNIDRDRTWKYPLSPHMAIYSPNILIMMDEDYDPYKWNEMYFLDFIAMPGIRQPKLQKGKLTVEDYQLLTEKIQGIFEVALHTQHDSIVLGALGCGAFGNPPEEVARCFQEVIDRGQYKLKFKNIIFAILDGSRTNNFEIFQKIIK